jgi:hypothetical protein
MRASLVALVVVVSACGPDVSAWKGTYSGTAVVNDGRQPQAYTGTLLIADGARFEGSAVSGGTTFSCALNASSADATTAGFTVPTNCDLVASPADGCTYKVTVNTASATRNGNSIEGTVNGRLNKSCTGGSSTATDFSMTIVGMR